MILFGGQEMTIDDLASAIRREATLLKAYNDGRIADSTVVIRADLRSRTGKVQEINYRVVHFATHGLIDTRYPALSALALSSYDTNGQMQQGLLRLQDIYSLRLNASLAVLSACDTALGREVRGEGLIGLTRGFLHAGAQSVVATLWQVPDRATAALMERFYRGLIEDGLQPVRALRAAQLGIRSERRWANPHFWAAFVVQGDWQSFAEQNLASNCRSHCEAEVARATGRDP
jgi:CHAT domain-containing protein